MDDRAIQIINCRVQATGQVIKAPLSPRTVRGTVAEAPRRRARYLFRHARTAGWKRPYTTAAACPPAIPFHGPALVEEMSSTTVVGAGHHAVVDDYGNLIITLQGNANG